MNQRNRTRRVARLEAAPADLANRVALARQRWHNAVKFDFPPKTQEAERHNYRRLQSILRDTEKRRRQGAQD